MTRKVHLRTQGVINLGHTRTYCGRIIYYVRPDTVLSSAVVDFGDFDATVHGTLVTCERCKRGTYHAAGGRRMIPEKLFCHLCDCFWSLSRYSGYAPSRCASRPFGEYRG